MQSRPIRMIQRFFHKLRVNFYERRISGTKKLKAAKNYERNLLIKGFLGWKIISSDEKTTFFQYAKADNFLKFRLLKQGF
jgi:hypothetical protein